MPLPNAELIGLPAPAWLLQSLLVLTFSLHLVPMTLTVGGTLIALYLETMARVRAADLRYRMLAQRLWRLLPVITSFTITLGVAPLLFIQLIYGKFFYPASVLTAWSWFAVIPVLGLGYGMLYWQSMGAPEGRWRPWAGLVAVLCFLGAGAIYISTMALTTEPSVWKAFYTATQSGTNWFFQLPRALHVLTGAVAMAGGLVSLIGHLVAADAAFSRFARRTGLAWLTGGLLLAVPAGLWYLSTLDATARGAVSTWLLTAVGAVAALSYLTFLFAGRRVALAWTAMGGLALTGVLLAVQRHLARQAVLSQYLTDADWKLQGQWDVFVIFSVLLVGTLGLIGYLLIRYLRAAAAAESKLGHSAD